MRQLIVVRKDLEMSPGKIAVQVSHASMAFMRQLVLNNTTEVMHSAYNKLPVGPYRHPILIEASDKAKKMGKNYFFVREEYINSRLVITEVDDSEVEYVTVTNGISSKQCDNWSDIINDWFKADYKKIVCGAKNRNGIKKAVDKAVGLGLVENKDFFIIKDRCYTELTPEETDSDGNPCTVTCIGFKPLDDETCNKISKLFQLY